MDAPYRGSEKLVVCFDIGTTQSAVSIVHLRTGEVPEVSIVNRWPGGSISTRVPSVILYDPRGRARAFGSSTLEEESVQALATSQRWTPARWFKLHLHPPSMEPPMYAVEPNEVRERVFDVPRLPRGVTAEKAYEDFFRYLVQAAKEWITDSQSDGAAVWERLERETVFVVAHPNSWETAQQGELATALRRALATGVSLDDRLVFVTEAEASVHFALQGDSAPWLQPGTQFAVVDAGGSTVDTTIYDVERMQPNLQLREVKNSDCVQAGAIFPLRQARYLIDAKLRSSKFKSGEHLDRIMREWDDKVKTKFAGTDDPDFVVRFGHDKDNDKKRGIDKGRMTIPAVEVEKAFTASIDLILASVNSQLNGTNVKHALLTGGFGSSPYLRRRLREACSSQGISLVLSDDPTQKAVATGAALFFVKEVVVARAARFDYGTKITLSVTKELGDTGRREVYTATDGRKRIRGGWERIVKRGQILESGELVTKALIHDIRVGEDFNSPYDILVCRDTQLGDGLWVTDEFGDFYPGFKPCATIKADLSPLATPRTLHTNPKTGVEYYSLEYKIGIFFGGTSLRACYIWEENGIERRGKAAVIPAAYT